MTALAAGALGTAVVAGVACITSAPPDLPVLRPRGPQILHGAVQPSANQYLTDLADGVFLVPVEVDDSTRPILGRVFVDYNSTPDNGVAKRKLPDVATLPAVDGGVTLLKFTLTPTDLGDPRACHTIQFLVGYTFPLNFSQTAGDSLGADPITWFYVPNGPNGCVSYDAGDGAPSEAGTDGLPYTPDATR